MKRLILLIVTCAMVAVASAQEITASKVPSAATSAFKKHFPDIKSVNWELEDGQYEASFITKPNGEVNYEAIVKHMDLIFDEKGKFLKEVKEENDDKDKKH